MTARSGRVREAAKLAMAQFPWVYTAARRSYSIGRYCLRRPHDDDYAMFTLFPDRRGLFLDVGANSGASALSFRIYNNRSPILSVEPNPIHDSDLRFVSRIAQPHSVLMCAAGDERGEIDLHVPFYRGTPLTAVGSVVKEQVRASLRRRLGDRMESSHFEVRTYRVPVQPLDDLDLDVAYLKIDVEGFELAALHGLSETLRRSRPVMLSSDRRMRNSHS